MARPPSTAPYHKRNLGWPLSWEGSGFGQRTLIERYESALKHLALTPRGSYYADSGYGTLLYRMRTQNMTPGLVGALLEDLRAGAAKYVPDIVIQDLEAEIEADEHLLRVFVKWSVRGTDREMHGSLARQRTTYLNV